MTHSLVAREIVPGAGVAFAQVKKDTIFSWASVGFAHIPVGEAHRLAGRLPDEVAVGRAIVGAQPDPGIADDTVGWLDELKPKNT